MATKIITGIDIGTASIKGVAATYNHSTSKFEILSQVKMPVFGVRKGAVIDPNEVAKAIGETVKKIESQNGCKIEGVYANLNGWQISSQLSRGQIVVSRADQKISSEDIERVIQGAKAYPVQKNREIIDSFPKEFFIDGVGGIKSPLDMQGTRLEADLLLVEISSQYTKNTTQAILNAGLRLNDFSPGILLSQRVVLTDKERERGVALLDIGAGTSSLAVFEEGVLLHVATLPVGSNDITNDIVAKIKCDIDTADKLRLEFTAQDMLKGGTKKEKVVTESGEEIIFTKNELRKAIATRLSETFSLINEELKKVSKDNRLPAGVVLTGGTALLPGIVELARKELGLPARVGLPQGFNPEVNNPEFSVACGAVVFGYEQEGDYGLGFFSKTREKIKGFFKHLIP